MKKSAFLSLFIGFLCFGFFPNYSSLLAPSGSPASSASVLCCACFYDSSELSAPNFMLQLPFHNSVCGHRICQTCLTGLIESWRERRLPVLCPACRTPIERSFFVENGLGAAIESLEALQFRPLPVGTPVPDDVPPELFLRDPGYSTSQARAVARQQRDYQIALQRWAEEQQVYQSQQEQARIAVVQAILAAAIGVENQERRRVDQRQFRRARADAEILNQELDVLRAELEQQTARADRAEEVARQNEQTRVQYQQRADYFERRLEEERALRRGLEDRLKALFDAFEASRVQWFEAFQGLQGHLAEALAELDELKRCKAEKEQVAQLAVQRAKQDFQLKARKVEQAQENQRGTIIQQQIQARLDLEDQINAEREIYLAGQEELKGRIKIEEARNAQLKQLSELKKAEAMRIKSEEDLRVTNWLKKVEKPDSRSLAALPTRLKIEIPRQKLSRAARSKKVQDWLNSLYLPPTDCPVMCDQDAPGTQNLVDQASLDAKPKRLPLALAERDFNQANQLRAKKPIGMQDPLVRNLGRTKTGPLRPFAKPSEARAAPTPTAQEPILGIRPLDQSKSFGQRFREALRSGWNSLARSRIAQYL